MRRHPSRRALRKWAAGERESVTKHIEACPDCLVALDELTEFDPLLRNALHAVTRPEPGFMDRLEDAVTNQQRRADDWVVALDLFTLGWRTLGTIVEDDG